MKLWNMRLSLRKKCPYTEIFWSAFSHIRTKHGEIRSISPYSLRMRENLDQNNSEYGHFSRSVWFLSGKISNHVDVVKERNNDYVKTVSIWKFFWPALSRTSVFTIKYKLEKNSLFSHKITVSFRLHGGIYNCWIVGVCSNCRWCYMGGICIRAKVRKN